MTSNTTQLVKIALLSGRKLTVREMDKEFSTNNSAEIIRRLRAEGMVIDTTWKLNEKTGKRYGEYSTPKAKKVNRITSQTYSRV